ncbi:MAG: hypothetical protein DRP56_07605, partial [Planctomycetota bacterium]
PSYRISDTRPLARMNKKEIRFNHLATKKYLNGMALARVGFDRQTEQIVVVPAAKDSRDLKMLTLMMAKRCMRVSVGGFIKQFDLSDIVGSEFEIDLKDGWLVLTRIVPPKTETPPPVKHKRKSGSRKHKPIPQTDAEIRDRIAAVNNVQLFYDCAACGHGPEKWKELKAGHPVLCPKCNGLNFEKTPREYKKPELENEK